MNCPRTCINLENDGDAYTGCATYFCTNVAHANALLKEANEKRDRAAVAHLHAQRDFMYGRAERGEVERLEQELILAEMDAELRADAFALAVNAKKEERTEVTLDDEERANCAIHDDRCAELSDWL